FSINLTMPITCTHHYHSPPLHDALPISRQAGMSCSTCHVNGASNAKFFVPKMSTRPGNFDTTGPLFNPKADNFVLDPIRIPSLRDRKSTRLNSSHRTISYAVFCLI